MLQTINFKSGPGVGGLFFALLRWPSCRAPALKAKMQSDTALTLKLYFQAGRQAFEQLHLYSQSFHTSGQ